jgi:hypothetical protein
VESYIPIAVIASIICLALFIQKSKKCRVGDVWFCKNCGHSGKASWKHRGSATLEVALWLCLIIPGVFYTMWRGNGKVRWCKKCFSKDIIPSDTPVAIKSNYKQ